MTLTHLLPALAVAGALLAGPRLALADDGHGHGPAAPTATAPAQPRFAAVSEAFELVGVLQGQQITLYLDRAEDNSPVTGAQIELDIAGTTLKATPDGDTYRVELAAEPTAGVLPITATVQAGQETDLLAGELDVHAEAHEEPAPARLWSRWAAWAAGGLLLVALLGGLLRRTLRGQGPAHDALAATGPAVNPATRADQSRPHGAQA